MPKERKQINIRLNDETQSRLERIRAVASETVGTALTYSDLFRMALTELERKYPAGKGRAKK